MYNVHQDATLLPLTIKSPDYTLGDKKLPAISASASRDKNGLTHISLVNIDAHNPQTVTLTLEGGKLTTVTGRILTARNLQDHNTFDHPDAIKPAAFKDAQLKGNTLQVKIPPFSVVVLEGK